MSISGINGGYSISSIYQNMDTNSNSSVNYEEFAESQNSATGMQSPPPPPLGTEEISTEELFNEIDTDGSGDLSQEEFESHMQAKQEEMQSMRPQISTDMLAMISSEESSNLSVSTNSSYAFSSYTNTMSFDSESMFSNLLSSLTDEEV